MNKVQVFIRHLLVFLGYCLAGVVVGSIIYYVNITRADDAQRRESVMTKRLQQANSGDFVIMKNGEVFRIQEVNSELTPGDRHFAITYDTRMTSMGYFRKPLGEIAREAADIVYPIDAANYHVISKCFYDGKYVTTQGAERLTCGN